MSTARFNVCSSAMKFMVFRGIFCLGTFSFFRHCIGISAEEIKTLDQTNLDFTSISVFPHSCGKVHRWKCTCVFSQKTTDTSPCDRRTRSIETTERKVGTHRCHPCGTIPSRFLLQGSISIRNQEKELPFEGKAHLSHGFPFATRLRLWIVLLYGTIRSMVSYTSIPFPRFLGIETRRDWFRKGTMDRMNPESIGIRRPIHPVSNVLRRNNGTRGASRIKMAYPLRGLLAFRRFSSVPIGGWRSSSDDASCFL